MTHWGEFPVGSQQWDRFEEKTTVRCQTVWNHLSHQLVVIKVCLWSCSSKAVPGASYPLPSPTICSALISVLLAQTATFYSIWTQNTSVFLSAVQKMINCVRMRLKIRFPSISLKPNSYQRCYLDSACVSFAILLPEETSGALWTFYCFSTRTVSAKSTCKPNKSCMLTFWWFDWCWNVFYNVPAEQSWLTFPHGQKDLNKAKYQTLN